MGDTSNASKIYPVPLKLLNANEKKPEFKENILSRFKKKVIADICHTDSVIQMVKIFGIIAAVRKSVMGGDIRRLATLYIQFKEHIPTCPYQFNIEGNLGDLFKR